jgi:hypothetical protein
MEGNTPIKQNKFLEFIKGNEKLVLIAGGTTLVLGVIVASIISMNNAIQPATVTIPTPEPTKRTTQVTRTPPSRPQPTIIFSGQERTVIETQTKPQIDNVVNVPYTVSQAKGYGEEWAIIEITNPTTDPANVVVKNENGTWVVKLGPGTSFEEAELRAIGAPQSLIDEINGDI